MQIDVIMSMTIVLTTLTWAFLISMFIILFFRRKKERNVEEVLYKIGDAIKDIEISVAEKMGVFEKTFKEYSPQQMNEKLVKIDSTVSNTEKNFEKTIAKEKAELKSEIDRLKENIDFIQKSADDKIKLNILEFMGSLGKSKMNKQISSMQKNMQQQFTSMYDFMLREVFDTVEKLNETEGKELGSQIRRLEFIVRDMSNKGLWNKDYEKDIMKFIKRMREKWAKEKELSILFKMEEDRIKEMTKR